MYLPDWASTLKMGLEDKSAEWLKTWRATLDFARVFAKENNYVIKAFYDNNYLAIGYKSGIIGYGENREMLENKIDIRDGTVIYMSLSELSNQSAPVEMGVE